MDCACGVVNDLSAVGVTKFPGFFVLIFNDKYQILLVSSGGPGSIPGQANQIFLSNIFSF